MDAKVITGARGEMPAFFAIDFFCGAGGTTRGLIDAGGYVVAGIDKADGCDETYQLNNANRHLDGAHARYLKRDVFEKTEEYPEGEREELFADLLSMLGPLTQAHPRVPLMFAICAPCQPFTRLTQIELTDERSKGRERDQGLLSQTLPFIDELMPDMILCENVAGIQKASYGGVWQKFMADLGARGYETASALVNAAGFGVPQNRRRSIMLAVHRDSLRPGAGSIEVPLSDPATPPATVRSAIGHLPPIEAGSSCEAVKNHRSANLIDINRRRLEAVAPGGNNHVFIGTDLELECHRKMRAKEESGEKADYTAGFSDVYCRMDPDKPAPAITTKFFASSCGRFGHYDPAQVRAISIREGAALQSFPDDYVFHGGSIQRDAKMVGNAVPPRLSEFFARHLTGMLDPAGRRSARPIPASEAA